MPVEHTTQRRQTHDLSRGEYELRSLTRQRSARRIQHALNNCQLLFHAQLPWSGRPLACLIYACHGAGGFIAPRPTLECAEAHAQVLDYLFVGKVQREELEYQTYSI